MNADKYTLINTSSVTLCNFVGIYFCMSEVITIIANDDSQESQKASIIIGIFFAALSVYGISTLTYSNNLKSQQDINDELDDIDIESELSETLNKDASGVSTIHYGLTCYALVMSNWMACVFPFLFVINAFGNSFTQATKISLCVAGTMFAAASSVAPVRAYNNSLSMG